MLATLQDAMRAMSGMRAMRAMSGMRAMRAMSGMRVMCAMHGMCAMRGVPCVPCMGCVPCVGCHACHVGVFMKVPHPERDPSVQDTQAQMHRQARTHREHVRALSVSHRGSGMHAFS